MNFHVLFDHTCDLTMHLTQALVARIQGQHRNAFGSALDSIAAKYGVDVDGGGMPDEAAFEAAAARLAARRASSTAKGGNKSSGVVKKKKSTKT